MHKGHKRRTQGALAVLGSLLLTVALDLRAESEEEAPYGVAKGNEELLVKSLQNLQAHDFDAALQSIEALTAQRPDFRLAQLVYADLMASRGVALSGIGNRAGDEDTLKGLISEAKARLLIEMEKPSADMVPQAMVMLGDQQPSVIVIDTRLSRLFLFENRQGQPYLVKDFYISYGRGGVGKEKQGDLKTPLGVYFVTNRLEDRQLPSKYGSGALPINYPNTWDARLGRTGNGIWVHGSPLETYSRSPLASEGCISLTNPDFVELDSLVDISNTPVLIGENVHWMKRNDWLAQQQEFDGLLQGWKADWEGRDLERYLDYYSPDYKDARGGIKTFTGRKTRAIKAKSYIKVAMDNISLYRYPDNPDLMVATFQQRYESSNYNGTMIKRQYWLREEGSWRIVYEGKPSRGRQ